MLLFAHATILFFLSALLLGVVLVGLMFWFFFLTGR